MMMMVNSYDEIHSFVSSWMYWWPMQERLCTSGLFRWRMMDRCTILQHLMTDAGQTKNFAPGQFSEWRMQKKIGKTFAPGQNWWPMQDRRNILPQANFLNDACQKNLEKPLPQGKVKWCLSLVPSCVEGRKMCPRPENCYERWLLRMRDNVCFVCACATEFSFAP